MDRFKDWIWLVVIIGLMATAVYIIQSPDYPIRQGLDLQGGLQVLLEADVATDQEITADQMDTARQIIDSRVNALGVAEPLVQLEGDRRILVELPGIENPEEAIALIQETALLEFVDSGSQPLPEGVCIRTSLNDGQPSRCELDGIDTATSTSLSTGVPTYETIMTGADLREAHTQLSGLNQYYVAFTLQNDKSQFFGDYTRDNVGSFLTIVLDKQVISSPQIQGPITGGEGSITGQFTPDEASRLALQLRFGSLPVPLRIESTRQVGATLGQQSVEASVRAGAIGIAMVLIFMMAYYRLPGFLADIALIVYMLINFLVYETLPVTLTLPAITGFLLSTGMAVDANVLIFERLKEELNNGSLLQDAIHDGFSKAWVSIRDSNIATLVICLVLWVFGRSFGASAVQGFALTLAIGVMISMFTAVFVTRTLVNLVIGLNARRFRNKKWLIGA
ncbi:MAG: protein translocase subunit SecD [Chloroflexi bacterium]|nr:protein translocase subunit SecD [Chloroflexota bacterium]